MISDRPSPDAFRCFFDRCIMEALPRITRLIRQPPHTNKCPKVCLILKQKCNRKSQYGLKAAPTSHLWSCHKKSELRGRGNKTSSFSRFTELLLKFRDLSCERPFRLEKGSFVLLFKLCIFGNSYMYFGIWRKNFCLQCVNLCPRDLHNGNLEIILISEWIVSNCIEDKRCHIQWANSLFPIRGTLGKRKRKRPPAANMKMETKRPNWQDVTADQPKALLPINQTRQHSKIRSPSCSASARPTRIRTCNHAHLPERGDPAKQ